MARAPAALLRTAWLGALALALAAPAAQAVCPGAPLLKEQASWSGARTTAGAQSAAGSYVQWRAPLALAARNGFLYVADRGLRQIMRLDLAQQSMSAYLALPAQAAPAMLLGPDMSLYLADGMARQVLHYGFDGRALGQFADRFLLGRPVGMALGADGSLWVADALLRQVARFDRLGHAYEPLKVDEAQAVDGVASAGGVLYLLDRLQRQVLQVDQAGRLRAVLGEGELRLPAAMAVDQHGRVFVADSFDQQIKVFVDGQLQDPGPQPPRFTAISALALERDSLFVADSAAARVVQLHIAAPCKEETHVP